MSRNAGAAKIGLFGERLVFLVSLELDCNMHLTMFGNPVSTDAVG
jgi:hypothetical protein